MKRLPLLMTIALVVACVGTALAAVVQIPVSFADEERVIRFVDGHPYEATQVLKAILSQEQVDELERRMFPAPSSHEQRRGLTEVKLRLRRMGLTEDDALVRAVTTRIEALGHEGGQETTR